MFAARSLLEALHMKPLLAVIPLALAGTAHAGELDLDFGLQTTHTQWDGDHGGGAVLSAGWLFRPWIGASFIGKEQYATIDDRYMSYYSVNALFRHAIDRFR